MARWPSGGADCARPAHGLLSPPAPPLASYLYGNGREESRLVPSFVPPDPTTLLATWDHPGEVGIRAGWSRRAAGGSLLDALEAGLTACERDPALLLIGRGALPNADGAVQLDASVMVGEDLSAGAVCALEGLLPAISVARLVMERTPHLMLAGEGARRFAIENGFRPESLMTATNVARYEAWRAGRVPPDLVHSTHEERDQEHGDTVTMLAREETPDGPRFVAASSTSGTAWKRAGRVGDSPIVGAGIYADDEAGAAGATGLGEELWRAAASSRTVAAMGRGLSAQEACEETVAFLLRRRPEASRSGPCVVFALGRDGSSGAATTEGEFPFWSCVDGGFERRSVRAS